MEMWYLCIANMSGKTFRFKKFEVKHANSSMRVGTDAVLLGAWADVGECRAKKCAKVLDIGCGCGLIALMVAQRCETCHVTGIDIDSPSVDEANWNAMSSPFFERVSFRQEDVREFVLPEGEGKYDLILCNPPYYTEDTLPPEQRRSMARNASHLSFSELVESVCRLLSSTGLFAVIIPMQERGVFVGEALKLGLHIRRECHVQTVLRKAPKRVLLEFGFQQNDDTCIETLVLQDSAGGRTEEYSTLCREFYL